MSNGLSTFPDSSNAHELFSSEFQAYLVTLHNDFNAERLKLLSQRKERQKRFDQGEVPTFEAGHPAKSTSWKVAPIPSDMMERKVEITGPVSSAKMVINMLSVNQEGELASTAMLDFEDSMAPTWENVINGYKNIIGVANKNLTFVQKDKVYRLDPNKMSRPMVRVRGLHMNEKNYLIDGQPVSAGMLDLFTTAYHTAKIFIQDGKTPKFYVPKCEHYLEARWWNKVFDRIESILNLSQGQLKATFLIETLPAAFQMEEILYELRSRACGLNGGRWDKIFSDIKTLKMHSDRIMADRSTIDMKKPWMDNYAKLLIKTCHKHGAFAMGGMSAFTPGSDEATRAAQMEKVRQDKEREASIGHDGCWVSHPYFISMARAQFKKQNQLDVLLSDFPENPDLLPKGEGPRTLQGLRQNLRVGIAYQHGWNEGNGCIAFENLMEDLATLEISRAQVWQWLHHEVTLDDGTQVTAKLVEKILDEEFSHILPLYQGQEEKLRAAKEQIKQTFLRKELSDFFTDH